MLVLAVSTLVCFPASLSAACLFMVWAISFSRFSTGVALVREKCGEICLSLKVCVTAAYLSVIVTGWPSLS
jgi:hypothetical protein